MALNKPTFKVNLAANRKVTDRKSVFFDLKPNSTTRLRVLPPVTEDGAIFTKVVNHFKLKTDENRGIALACLEEHGNPQIGTECYLCALSKLLRNSDDKAEKKISNDIRASARWYVQALIFDKATNSYFGPKLIGLSKTTADQLNAVLTAQEESGDDFFCDAEKGQDIIIKRVGSTMNDTEYTVLVTGQKAPLDTVFPDWAEKIITDTYAAIELKLEDMDGQKRAAHRSYADEIDWEVVEENIG